MKLTHCNFLLQHSFFWALLIVKFTPFKIYSLLVVEFSCHSLQYSFVKKNTAKSKIICNYVMSANCDDIFFFPIYGQFAAIWKSGSRRMVCKTYVFINSSNISGGIKAVLFIHFFFYEKISHV